MTSYISLPMYAASIGQRLRLIAGKCTRCGTLAYPQRTVCIACGNRSFTETALKGTGTLYTYTIIAAGGAPSEFDDQQTMAGAIVCGVVELDEGPRVIGQIADAEVSRLAVGMRVQAEMRRLYDQEGIVRYGTKFVPAPG